MLQVGRMARVEQLNRPAPEDRSRYVGREGLIVQRLNTPWTPDLGALWKLRFEDGEESVFSESEVLMLDENGTAMPSRIPELSETWGEAPRTMSVPFRRFGAGVGGATAILALLVFCVAGVLLIWAGLAEGPTLLAIAGGLLVAIGIGAAAVLVS